MRIRDFSGCPNKVQHDGKRDWCASLFKREDAKRFVNAERFLPFRPRLQYVVVNLTPTQEEILEFLFIKRGLALTELTDSQYDTAINPPDQTI